MQLRTFIVKGRAVLTADALRCAQPRAGDAERICNKLLVKRNAFGQVAGNFLCGRCKQIVEVKIAPTN